MLEATLLLGANITLRTKQLLALSALYVGVAISVVCLVIYLWNRGGNANWFVAGALFAVAMAGIWMNRKKNPGAETDPPNPN